MDPPTPVKPIITRQDAERWWNFTATLVTARARAGRSLTDMEEEGVAVKLAAQIADKALAEFKARFPDE